MFEKQMTHLEVLLHGGDCLIPRLYPLLFWRDQRCCRFSTTLASATQAPCVQQYNHI